MKAQSVGGRMSRVQEKLLQQRLRLSKQRQQQAAIVAETEQWRTARDDESRVKSWWSFDVEDDATKRSTTSSSMTCNPCEMFEEEPRLMTKGAIGSALTSTKHCSMPAGSWKTLRYWSKTCDVCDSKLKMLKSNQNCKICGKNVCDRCRMTKLIYPSRNTGNFPCSYFFCKPCLNDAKEKLYGRGATRVSFHSEDSSGRSGSNRSGSPRCARAPSTGLPGLSMMSSSSDPTPGHRQRAPSRDPMGSATMPPFRARGGRPLSPRSSSSSYYSARATTSSDPSMSVYSASSMTGSGFSRINDNISSSSGAQSMRVFQPPSGRPSGRSVESRAAASPLKIQRSGSDTLRRNAASRAYTTSRMPAQHIMALPASQSSSGGIYTGNQSIDSTYDVEGSETYRGRGIMSDDSDLSEDSSDEEDVSVTSYSNRRRQPVNIYDGDEGSVVEINRDSCSSSDPSVEPEPVDVFEEDKLKYINSFRSNDCGVAGSTGTTASSNGSSDQENLMERLMQINMAAEATYLMTKYNSNIQGNASR